MQAFSLSGFSIFFYGNVNDIFRADPSKNPVNLLHNFTKREHNEAPQVREEASQVREEAPQVREEASQVHNEAQPPMKNHYNEKNAEKLNCKIGTITFFDSAK